MNSHQHSLIDICKWVTPKKRIKKMMFQTKVSAKRATKFRLASLNLISSIIRIKIRKLDLLPGVDHHLDRTNMGNLVFKEVQVSLNLNSNYPAYLAKVTNMIQLCNSNIRIPKALDSLIILSKATIMLVVFKTHSQILRQMV
jgi:hypothetical protein